MSLDETPPFSSNGKGSRRNLGVTPMPDLSHPGPRPTHPPPPTPNLVGNGHVTDNKLYLRRGLAHSPYFGRAHRNNQSLFKSLFGFCIQCLYVTSHKRPLRRHLVRWLVPHATCCVPRAVRSCVGSHVGWRVGSLFALARRALADLFQALRVDL